MHYYRIIPLTRLSLKQNKGYTYASPEKIAPGSLVEISLGQKTLPGIVFDIVKKPYFKLKKIKKIIQPGLLDNQQMKLAKNLSDYYFCSLGVVLKNFAFKLSKNIKESPLSINPFYKRPTPTSTQKKISQKISSCRQKKSFLLFGPASSGKTEILMLTTEDTIKKEKQVLILVPEMFLARQEIARWQARFKKTKIALFHSALKKTEMTNVYQNVKNGKIKIIISTRTGLFLPFKNLGLIALDEEQDLSYKSWDQNPHFHARKVAKELSKTHNCSFVLVSATPSLETYHQEKNIFRLPRLKTKKITIKKPKIKYVLPVFSNSKKRALFSPETLLAVKNNLTKKLISCFLVSSRGNSRFVICQGCKKLLRCPKCNSTLIRNSGSYKCLHCNFKQSAISKCPSCGSFQLIDLGTGTTGIASKLQTIFPKAKIATADGDTFQKDTAREKLMKDLRDNKIDILIGTYAIAKGLDIPKISLVVVLDIDYWPNTGDFNFDEKLLGSLFQFTGRVNRPGSDQKGQSFIQTFHPNQPLLKKLKTYSWENFVKNELKSRKALGYPPFSKLIKITVRHQTKKILEQNIEKIYNGLSRKISKKITVSKPYFGIREKRGSKWQESILIKYTPKKMPSELRNTLTNLNSNWDIDIDPEIIF